MNKSTDSKIPQSIRFGLGLLLLGPGLAVLGVGVALLLLTLAIFLFISLSGVLAIAFVAVGLLFMLGGLILWPVRKQASALIGGAVGAFVGLLIQRFKIKI